MSFSRRDFMQWAASSLAIGTPGWSDLISLFRRETRDSANSRPGLNGYRPDLLPTQKEVWDWQVWMAKLGPKYTGNKAHNDYVEFLAKNLGSLGLDIKRDHYTFPRWEAHRSALSVSPVSGGEIEIPVTSYFPYSGQTPAEGVTGELIYGGTATYTSGPPTFSLPSDVRGKIVFVECPVPPRPNAEFYSIWGVTRPDVSLPSSVHSAVNQAQFGLALTDFQKAGAAGVLLGWTDISDGDAADQYNPFGKPLQNVPGLWVGRAASSRLRQLAGTGAKATLILEAEVLPDSPTDTLLATLPGTTADEIIIVNTHTDGPNATE
jgi:hypothetical protein